MQGKFPLAYDDEQGSLYYWEPAAIQINKIDLRTNKKSAFNLHLFVSYGFYEEAMKNIKKLDREMVLILEGAKEDKQHLESLVEKYT